MRKKQINQLTKKLYKPSVLIAAALTFTPGASFAGYGVDWNACMEAGKTYTAFWETKEHNIKMVNKFPVYYSRTRMAMGIKAKSKISKGQHVPLNQTYYYKTYQHSPEKKDEFVWNGWPYRGVFTSNATNNLMGGCNPFQGEYGTVDCLEHDLCLQSKQHPGNALNFDSSCGQEYTDASWYIFYANASCKSDWAG